MADLTQQVKNFTATLQHKKTTVPHFVGESETVQAHRSALQALSNDKVVSYADTLRIVECEGSRSPKLAARVTLKHPGFIRNESGGCFTT